MQNWVYNLTFMFLKIIFLFTLWGNGWAGDVCLKKNTSAISLPQFQLNSPKKDPWFGKDKFDHFLTSAFLVTFFYHTGRSQMSWSPEKTVNLSAGLTFGIGLGKEGWDKKSKRGHPSWRDLAADLLGAGVGYFICLQGIKGR